MEMTFELEYYCQRKQTDKMDQNGLHGIEKGIQKKIMGRYSRQTEQK